MTTAKLIYAKKIEGDRRDEASDFDVLTVPQDAALKCAKELASFGMLNGSRIENCLAGASVVIQYASGKTRTVAAGQCEATA